MAARMDVSIAMALASGEGRRRSVPGILWFDKSAFQPWSSHLWFQFVSAIQHSYLILAIERGAR
jgi:hypothetical protein